MNLSAPTPPPSPARYPTANDHGTTADATAPGGRKEGFAELFADVAQRGGRGGKGLETTGSGIRDSISRRAIASSPKQRSRPAVEQEPRAKGKWAGENPLQNPELQLQQPAPNPAALGNKAPAGEDVSTHDEDGAPPVSGEPIANLSATTEDATGDQALISDATDAGQALAKNSSDAALALTALESATHEVALPTDLDAAGAAAIENSGSISAAVVASAQPKPAPGMRTAKPDASAAADFAAIETDAPNRPIGSKPLAAKNFLSSSVKEVTDHDEALGINVAKVGVEMSSVPLPRELEGLFSKETAIHAVASPSDFSTPSPAPSENPVVSDAHRAVEAVMEASEKFTTESQRAVNLQFSLNGGELSVRVELHEGQVRTTFRTDSAELRSALAQEWQALAATSGEHARRFADPVFAAGSSPFSAGNQGESQANHRDQEMRQPAGQFEVSASRSVSSGAAKISAVPAASLRPTAPLTALRLHTFA